MRFILIFPLLALLSCIARNLGPDSPPLSISFKNDFLSRVNTVRKNGCKCGNTYMPPVQPLSWNNLLEGSASGHARDMYRRKYFAHVSLSGKTIKNRIEEAGYTLTGMRTYAIGENIAAGQRSIDEVMRSWMASEGHCKNIMSKNFREIGVAETNLYWVQDFGMRVEKTNSK
jgi:uncharacterized protein YkwD